MKKCIIGFVVMALCFTLTACSSLFVPESEREETAGKKPSNTPLSSTYTVTFDTNGGSYVSDKRLNTLYEAPMTERENYEFCGWYRDEGLTVPAIYPLSVDSNMTLYAKWLRIGGTVRCIDTRIKFLDSNYNSGALYDLTPSGFDIAALASAGYALKIDVKYNVYYIKDYDVLWDIGYAGSPKYEIGIYNTEKIGKYDRDLTTSTSAITREFSYRTDAANLMKTNVYLEFSTDNIQNIICFRDIEATYTFYK